MLCQLPISQAQLPYKTPIPSSTFQPLFSLLTTCLPVIHSHPTSLPPPLSLSVSSVYTPHLIMIKSFALALFLASVATAVWVPRPAMHGAVFDPRMQMGMPVPHYAAYAQAAPPAHAFWDVPVAPQGCCTAKDTSMVVCCNINGHNQDKKICQCTCGGGKITAFGSCPSWAQ